MMPPSWPNLRKQNRRATGLFISKMNLKISSCPNHKELFCYILQLFYHNNILKMMFFTYLLAQDLKHYIENFTSAPTSRLMLMLMQDHYYNEII